MGSGDRGAIGRNAMVGVVQGNPFGDTRTRKVVTPATVLAATSSPVPLAQKIVGRTGGAGRKPPASGLPVARTNASADQWCCAACRAYQARTESAGELAVPRTYAVLPTETVPSSRAPGGTSTIDPISRGIESGAKSTTLVVSFGTYMRTNAAARSRGMVAWSDR